MKISFGNNTSNSWCSDHLAELPHHYRLVNGEYRNLVVKGRALTFLVINETNCQLEMFSASLTQIIDLLCNSLHYPGIEKTEHKKQDKKIF